ncbi:MAG: BaiN/RdsA family NAD(P)/FAD-dependent oxidoreductase [Bacillota bacterium]
MARVVVIGGGAAGCMAAGRAAELGAQVVLLEKNRRLGRKLGISGKGRCNLTNHTDVDGLVANLPGNGRFLRRALYAWDAEATEAFFAGLGVPVKVERGDRVFPVSDRAADVIAALERYLAGGGVEVRLEQGVSGLVIGGGAVTGVRTAAGERPADRVIVATGGASYPGTGSTGDGYSFAAAAGHTIVPIHPSLVPLVAAEPWVPSAQGLSLRNVRVTASNAKSNKVGEEFGEMLFTHYGVSGPVVLTLSRAVGQELAAGRGPVVLSLDLKPALDPERLDLRLQRDLGERSRKAFRNCLDALLPRRLIEPVVTLSGIDPDKPAHQVTREERRGLGALLKGMRLTITGTRPLKEAIITAGGVSTAEVDPGTMASRLVRGLYFAGEVLDVDGYTGGFNIQAAFASGRLAGEHAARE